MEHWTPQERPPGTNVDDTEQAAALDPTVGEGTPETAPELPAQAFEGYAMQRETVGISPKLVAAIISAVASYLVTQTVLDLPAIAVVVCQAIVVALAVYMAGPGIVVEKTPESE